METEPKLMFNNNSNSNDNVKMENRRIFRFLFCKFGFDCRTVFRVIFNLKDVVINVENHSK